MDKITRIGVDLTATKHAGAPASSPCTVHDRFGRNPVRLAARPDAVGSLAFAPEHVSMVDTDLLTSESLVQAAFHCSATASQLLRLRT
jgi:hypothetical protein